MPEMDGLELVAQIVSQYPLIPVILMTGRGSEETAVRALKSGAASYVPKSILTSLLVDTVQNVLAAAQEERCVVRLMDCLASSDTTFRLGNDAAMIGPLINYLHRTIRAIGVCDQACGIRVCVALEEAINNALFHGNLEISSAQRTGDSDLYRQLVAERLRTAPFRDRMIDVQAKFTRAGCHLCGARSGTRIRSRIPSRPDRSRKSGEGQWPGTLADAHLHGLRASTTASATKSPWSSATDNRMTRSDGYSHPIGSLSSALAHTSRSGNSAGHDPGQVLDRESFAREMTWQQQRHLRGLRFQARVQVGFSQHEQIATCFPRFRQELSRRTTGDRHSLHRRIQRSDKVQVVQGQELFQSFGQLAERGRSGHASDPSGTGTRRRSDDGHERHDVHQRESFRQPLVNPAAGRIEGRMRAVDGHAMRDQLPQQSTRASCP